MTDGSLLSPPEVPGLTGLTVLARGGYATVYRAEQESVGRDVAVKVENRTLENERDRTRFLREARAAGRMSSHPHVVDLFDAGVTRSGHPYLIMELCEGSYAERIRARPLGAAEARDVGVKIADALADAHELGVLHRDVKPANILYSRFGEPALADFGLAVLAEARDSSITLEVLTPAYAPPEMFTHGEPGPPVDVYSLSATLYALVAGHPPRWPDRQGPGLAALLDLFEREIPGVAGVPEEFVALLRRGMSNESARRPTAAELRDLLAALPLGAPPRTPLPVHPPAPDTDPVTGDPGPRSGGAGREHLTEAVRTQPVVLPPPIGGRAGHGPSLAAPPYGPPGGGPPAPPGPAPREPRLRRALPLLVSSAMLVLALLVAAVTWYGVHHRTASAHSGAAAAPAAGASGTRTGTVTVPVGVECGLPYGARCPSAAECYGALDTSGGYSRATARPCDRRHAWEVFALGTLPAGQSDVRHGNVRSLPRVRAVCNKVVLLTRLSADQVIGWRVDVLPPTPQQAAAGERTFRCLAGRGDGQLTGSVFAG